jgi:CRISPR type I-E-associated protein CasB/Cse2
MNETKEYPIDRFLDWVSEVARKDDRGTLAELRRGLSDTTQDQAWEHLIPYCADFDTNESHRAVWCAVGGLAALFVPDGRISSEPWSNLGTTMRDIAKGDGTEEQKALKSFEPKFRRALSCGDTMSLCELVVGIGRTADAKGVPMNLKRLFWDLWNWSDQDKREAIRLQWAKQYFRVIEPHSDASLSQEREDA